MTDENPPDSNPPPARGGLPPGIAILGALLVISGISLNLTHGTLHLVIKIVGAVILVVAVAGVFWSPAMRERRR